MTKKQRDTYINALILWRDSDKATRGPRPDYRDYACTGTADSRHKMRRRR